VIVVATGDLYTAGPLAAIDHTVDYLKVVFKFMGFSNISVIRAERQNFAMAARGLADAIAEAQALADRHSAADAGS
jgi:FMN-dependent NADH-azoreductase